MSSPPRADAAMPLRCNPAVAHPTITAMTTLGMVFVRNRPDFKRFGLESAPGRCCPAPKPAAAQAAATRPAAVRAGLS